MKQVGRPRGSNRLAVKNRTNWIPHKWPSEIQDLVKRRVEGLLHQNILTATPLHKIIESAYLQGIEDTFHALETTGRLKPVADEEIEGADEQS